MSPPSRASSICSSYMIGGQCDHSKHSPLAMLAITCKKIGRPTSPNYEYQPPTKRIFQPWNHTSSGPLSPTSKVRNYILGTPSCNLPPSPPLKPELKQQEIKTTIPSPTHILREKSQSEFIPPVSSRSKCTTCPPGQRCNVTSPQAPVPLRCGGGNQTQAPTPHTTNFWTLPSPSPYYRTPSISPPNISVPSTSSYHPQTISPTLKLSPTVPPPAPSATQLYTLGTSAPAAISASQLSAAVTRRCRRCKCPNCISGQQSDPNKPKQHICHIPGCGKVYGKTSHLKAHLRWHAGLRPFVCNWLFCNKAFTRSDELQRHLRTHSGEKRFACKECGKRFTRSDHLSKHLKTHRNKLAKEAEKNKDTIPNTESNEQKKNSDIEMENDENNIDIEVNVEN